MPGLNQTYDTLREEIGFFLGYRSDQSRWDEEQTRRIDAAIREGTQKFLYNTLAPGTNKVYRWSFLRQTHRFSTAADVWSYDLPDDFGSQERQIFYADDRWRPIDYVNEAALDHKRSLHPDANGPPRCAAVHAKQTANVAAQGFEVAFYPTPDGAYNLALPYHISGELLSAQKLYPPGGAPVARAFMMACKSEAALQTNDDRSLEADFQLALAAAINYDANRQGANLGYNGDRSDDRERGAYRPQSDYLVSFEGTVSDEEITLADL